MGTPLELYVYIIGTRSSLLIVIDNQHTVAQFKQRIHVALRDLCDQPEDPNYLTLYRVELQTADEDLHLLTLEDCHEESRLKHTRKSVATYLTVQPPHKQISVLCTVGETRKLVSLNSLGCLSAFVLLFSSTHVAFSFCYLFELHLFKIIHSLSRLATSIPRMSPNSDAPITW